jgi:serine phosphatase RsbU (regulator of sigma subunit)
MTGPESATPDEQRAALQAGFAHTDLTLEQLWTRYFALGGHADLFEVEAHLAGLMPLPRVERDVLALAVNERLDELAWHRRVPYSRAIRPGRPTEGPFAALVNLLEAGPRASTDRLPDLAASAGRMLGVEMTMHLVEHEQLRLVPLGRDGEVAGRRRGVDSTLAGRAFRTAEILSSESRGRPLLWVPIQDGADRLGVLEVGLATEADAHDPALREQCQWVAAMLGHLVASKGQYSDHLEALRRERPRLPSAELIWQQLPPLTAATGRFVVAGMLQPTQAVGGDAFDYSLSDTSVALAIFDAMGHGLAAGLMASAALAAYRSARRDGRGLYDQTGAVDGVVATTFPDSAFVTGVLADLDVRSGRLRYVNAGHPAPLLLRGGRVVKALTDGRRVPFGLDSVGLTIGEEFLQPGDWLALHTDGITEARDADGAWFGEERLVELLTRAAAAGQPPPETVRRLTRAVLDHQQGLLQDDASILLACWSSVPGGNCVEATVVGG